MTLNSRGTQDALDKAVGAQICIEAEGLNFNMWKALRIERVHAIIALF